MPAWWQTGPPGSNISCPQIGDRKPLKSLYGKGFATYRRGNSRLYRHARYVSSDMRGRRRCDCAPNGKTSCLTLSPYISLETFVERLAVWLRAEAGSPRTKSARQRPTADHDHRVPMTGGADTRRRSPTETAHMLARRSQAEHLGSARALRRRSPATQPGTARGRTRPRRLGGRLRGSPASPPAVGQGRRCPPE